MKKWMLASGLIVIIVGAFLFYNQLYYPPLPIENRSKKEVIEKVNESEGELVAVSNEHKNEWFITNEPHTTKVDEMVKKLVSQNGWMFTQKEGSGLFFEKQGDRLIATTQQWTSHYTLVEIPAAFNDEPKGK